MKALAAGNYELREKTGVDLGMLLFFPVHAGFGGRIRYLISGGSALPADVMKTFQGMGFNFYEGYGLTETAPVLTVTPPDSQPIARVGGQAAARRRGQDRQPDARGVGEVIARGRNLMLGYWQDEAATAEAVRDGWFHTGDLGRFDDDGNLYIVGRSKDVIIDSNGKNVYPDEVEDLYRESPFIKELSVVGLPDGTAEHVACAVVPNLEHDKALCRGRGRRRKIERALPDGVGGAAVLEAGQDAGVLGGRPAQDRQAFDQAPRGGGRAGAPAAEDGGRGRQRGRDRPRAQGGDRRRLVPRHPGRGHRAPARRRCTGRRGSASWASTA